jgi:hypothetical protein
MNQTTTQPQFSIDLNLDDEHEAQEFTKAHGTTSGRALANRLGFRGKNAAKAATALSCYAWNKVTAIDCRMRGKIETAQRYEAICDRIYRNTIQPLIACW